MKAPSFSIILPTYNRAHCICNAIDSVLKQTYQKFELIIIDDGSTDGTDKMLNERYADQLKSGKVIYKRIQKSGVCKARNEGLRLAKNDWIAYVDSDNTIMPYFLGVFTKEILKNPNIKNLYAQYQPMFGQRINWNEHIFSLERLKERNFIDLGVYVHHKCLVNELGGFDENMERLVDWDLILKQCIKYDPIYISLFVMKYNNEDKKDRITNSIMNVNRWLEYVHRKYDKNDNSQAVNCMNKIVCYTCITDNYDTLKMPYVMPDNIDFICFTNSNMMKSGWKIKKIPDELNKFSSVKQQRLIKILADKWLPEYDISIWVDGSIQIKDDLNKFIDQYDLNNKSFYVRKHPDRNCAYDEAKIIISMKKDCETVVNSQMNRYHKFGFPEKFGLFETNVLLRRHNDKVCKTIDLDWANEIKAGSHRDQLSLSYALWKNNVFPFILDKNNSIIKDHDQFFRWDSSHYPKYMTYDNSYVTIAICNFNTTKLTNNCIHSIINKCKSIKYKIIVLDNSDKDKFILDKDIKEKNIVKIIDNTTKKYINFDSFIINTFKKQSHNNHASAKHCYSIQFLLNICQTKYLILFDSDTLLINDIDFIDESCITIADTQDRKIDFRKKEYQTRFLPFIQMFNVQMINQNKITYFNSSRIGENTSNNKIYDTGASFYEDVLKSKIKYKKITFSKYVKHLNAGSWKKYTPYQCIVSFTTFGNRLIKLQRTCEYILKQQTSISVKICITLDANDIKKLTIQQCNFIKQHNIEIITGNNKLRPHNKYFFVMKKYRDIPIITIDDDIDYSSDLINLLYKSYLQYPLCVSSLRTHLITINDEKIQPYRKWIFQHTSIKDPSHMLFATGVGGILYPPDILKISDDDMSDINKSINADDVFLKNKELKLGIKVVFAGGNGKIRELSESRDKTALSYNSKNLYVNDQIIKNLNLEQSLMQCI